MQSSTCPLEHLPEEAGEAAAVQHDRQTKFPPQRMVRHDAEITADIGDDGADWPAADLRGNLFRRRQAG
jgi:hypothetical protein